MGRDQCKQAVTSTLLVSAVACLLLLLPVCQARSLAKSSGSCGKKLFWFMAITTRSDLEYWRYGTPCCKPAADGNILTLASPWFKCQPLRKLETSHEHLTESHHQSVLLNLQPRWQCCQQETTHLTSFQCSSSVGHKSQPVLKLLTTLSGSGSMAALYTIIT